MTLEQKTPMARKAAKSYCRRCLAVMLCCLLVFGLTVRVQPRAKAAVAEAVAVGSWTADAVLSTVGLEGLVAAGALIYNVDQAVQSNILGRGYDAGYNLGLAIMAGELSDACTTWLDGTVAAFKAAGGVAPGDTITIPADVAEAIRQWALTNLLVADGIVSYNDYVLSNSEGVFVLSDVDLSNSTVVSASSKLSKAPISHVGSVIGWPTFDYSADYTSSVNIGSTITVTYNYVTHSSLNKVINFKNGVIGTNNVIQSAGGSLSDAFIADYVSNIGYSDVLFYDASLNRLYVGNFSSAGDAVFYHSYAYLDLTEALPAMTTTFSSTDSTNTPITKDLTVTIPADLPVTDVGGVSVPVIDDLTSDELLKTPAVDVNTPTTGISTGEITSAVEAALPVTGAKVGDQVVGEVMEDQEGIGAIMVTKFPFSIPWDVYKAICLFASPPVTPKWELDFMAPIAYRVGGFRGDTKLVLDFGEYEVIGVVTRWVSTVMFVYALASGTKKLIWTA